MNGGAVHGCGEKDRRGSHHRGATKETHFHGYSPSCRAARSQTERESPTGPPLAMVQRGHRTSKKVLLYESFRKPLLFWIDLDGFSSPLARMNIRFETQVIGQSPPSRRFSLGTRRRKKLSQETRPSPLTSSLKRSRINSSPHR